LHKIKAEKFIFPKFSGQYFYFTWGHIYKAPSLRQIKIIRRHYKNKWKLPEYKIIEMILSAPSSSTPVILDIGANIGYTAIAYSHMLKSYGGFVIAFEPASINVDSFAFNTSYLSNIFLISVGLGDTSEPITLGIPSYVKELGKDTDNTGFLSVKLSMDNSLKAFRSASLPLDLISDSLCLKTESISFIKVDVEGYESRVIRGALNTIKHFRPTIQIEFYSRTNSSQELADTFSLLFDLQYTCYLNGSLSQDVRNELYFVHSSNNNLTTIFNDFNFSKVMG